MKNKKDIMFVKERYNNKGELRYELHASYKDPFTKKNKVCVKTFALPNNINGKKEKEEFRLKCQFDLKEELSHIGDSNYLHEKELDTLFCDYANKWVENILKNNKESYNHYSHCKENLKIFEEHFRNYSLRDMNRRNIQRFCEWLNERKYIKQTFVVKKSMKEIIKNKKLLLTNVAKFCDISTTTLDVALVIGNHVNKKTAVRICEFLNLKINDYFNISNEEILYSKSSNRAVKVMLSSILKQAQIDGIIDINYASSDYIKPIKGGEKTRNIIQNSEELKNFVNCINREQDIRKKTAFYISISLGLRGREISGLSWEDINFENETIYIHKGTMYVSGFGVITKNSAKTKTSNRIISMPRSLVEKLKEYKIWWENKKQEMGDLWSNTTKLFVRINGTDMPNTTIAGWLKEFERENNLKNITFHGLRHSVITMEVANKVDIKTVSARAGHSNIQTTLDIYSHYLPQADKKASDIMERLLCVN